MLSSFAHRDKTGAEGTIELIDITWGDFTVKNQAFSEFFEILWRHVHVDGLYL